MKNKELEKSESGYNEKKQAINIEARSGDLQALKRSKGFQSNSSTNKTLIAYQSVSNKLNELIGMYITLSAVNPHRAQNILLEIAELKGVQEVLFTELVGVCSIKHTKEQAEEKIKNLIQ